MMYFEISSSQCYKYCHASVNWRKYDLEAIIKLLFIFPYIMINVYYSCYNCIDRKPKYMCEYINKYRVPTMPLLDQLVDQRWLKFPNHGHVLSFDERDHIIREWCDGQDPSVSLALLLFSLLLLLSSWLIHVPLTMRLCNSRMPEEHYQTSQRNWWL